MPKLTIDGIEFNTEDLNENQSNLLKNITYSDQQITRLQQEIAIYKTARETYITVLKQETNSLSDLF